MSGGSMNYFCHTLEEYENSLGDKELNDLVHDLVQVFHDREWMISGDISEGAYNETVASFKDKWFSEPGKNRRYIEYIDTAIGDLKRELRLDCNFCKDCEHWDIDKRYESIYGRCEYHKGCVMHGYENACEKFGKRQ